MIITFEENARVIVAYNISLLYIVIKQEMHSLEPLYHECNVRSCSHRVDRDLPITIAHHDLMMSLDSHPFGQTIEFARRKVRYVVVLRTTIESQCFQHRPIIESI